MSYFRIKESAVAILIAQKIYAREINTENSGIVIDNLVAILVEKWKAWYVEEKMKQEFYFGLLFKAAFSLTLLTKH